MFIGFILIIVAVAVAAVADELTKIRKILERRMK